MFENIIHYFQNLDQRPVERLVFMVGGMLVLWLLEGGLPLISLKYKKNKVRHAVINFSFTVIHLVIHTGFALIIILLSDWARNHNIGLVQWTGASVIATIIISILVLDFFGGWLVHFVQHKVKWMWRFHIVHHSDNNVDVTTALRHHPVESVLRGVFFLIGVVVAGAPMYAVMIFQTLLVVFVQFTHANINLPRRFDKLLSWIFVSPNMHKVHHHYKQPFTDSNYGAILSVWDRVMGTFKTLDPRQIVYGLDRYYPNNKDENFTQLMKHPFFSGFYNQPGEKEVEEAAPASSFKVEV